MQWVPNAIAFQHRQHEGKEASASRLYQHPHRVRVRGPAQRLVLDKRSKKIRPKPEKSPSRPTPQRDMATLTSVLNVLEY